ncbi:hypothetical protein ACFSJY_02305 [Thalassotalea euphylliae]|uniref:hypothetical protein n=1 Tax=Thalassotalea euphylliae TaxID=1655234 RepID=UPI0036384EEF
MAKKQFDKNKGIDMKKILLILTSILALNAQANEADIRKELQKHVDGLNQESLPKTTSSFHSQSPQYAPFTQMMQQSFQQYDISIEMKEIDYVGRSGEYVVAKVTSQAVRKSGAPFIDNQSTTFYFFKKDGTEWKIWAFMGVDSVPLR